MTRLRKLDPIVISKVVVSVNRMQSDRLLCFAFSDGTVQYRDRFHMNEVYNEPNTNSIMSPLQVGFQYTNDTPCKLFIQIPGNSCTSTHAESYRSAGGFLTDQLLLCSALRGLDGQVEQVTVPCWGTKYTLAGRYVLSYDGSA